MQRELEMRSTESFDLGPGGVDWSTVIFNPPCRKLAENGMWTRILGR
jgi:hypothetical protein